VNCLKTSTNSKEQENIATGMVQMPKRLSIRLEQLPNFAPMIRLFFRVMKKN